MPLYLGQDDAGTSSFSLQDFEPSWGSKMNAAVSEAWLESYGPAGVDYIQSRRNPTNEPTLTAAEAADAVKQSGLKLRKTPGDGEYTKSQLDVLLERQRELTAIKDVRERTPWDLSSPLRGVGMFGAGIADPINLATAFVPWTKTLPMLNALRASTLASSALTRAGARAALGGADAAISTAVLEAPYAYVRNEIGDDYGAIDSMANIAFGAAFGSAINVGGGAGMDALRKFTGRVQPFERFRGLANEDVQTVMALDEAIKGGMDARDVQRALETFTPEMRRAAGFNDAAARAGMREIAPERVEEEAPAGQGSAEGTAGLARTAAEIRAEMPTKRSDLLAYLRRNGGISPALAREAGGENGARLNRLLPGIVKKTGANNYDELAVQLVEDGWLPPGTDPLSIEAADAAADIVSRALSGEQVLRIEDRIRMQELRDAEDFEAVMEMEREFEMARQAELAEAAMARNIVGELEPDTRESALRGAVGQSIDGRIVDVDAVVGMDPALGTATQADAIAAAERTFSPEQVDTADFDASAAVQERVDAAPRWDGVADAEAALAEADAMLSDTVKAGDQAFKYSRGEAPGQKKATLWQGTTARFAPEDGAPLGRFRWDMINSAAGEGAQAFGYGHYLAQQAWISQTRYRERLLDRRQGDDSYSIPDGAGGVLQISARRDDAAWQLADGTIVHTQQKDPKLAAAADAVAQVEKYGFARALETFQNVLKGAKEELAAQEKKLTELESSGDAADEILQARIAMQKRGIEFQQKDIAHNDLVIATLGEVTVEPGKLWEVFDPKDGVAVARFATEAEAKADADTRGQLFDYAGRANELAPGIKKFEPPKPDNLRTRVMAGGVEITGDLADFIEIGFEPKRELAQTLGAQLQEVAASLEGLNVEAKLTALLDNVLELQERNPSPKKEAVIQQLQELQARGITTATVERPGSLYRAEMEGADFQNLALWDEPMSAQPAVVQAAFKRFGIEDKPDPVWTVREDGYLELESGSNVLLIKFIDDPDLVEKPTYAVYRNGRLSTTEATLEDAKRWAQEFAGLKKLTVESAYMDLRILIEEGGMNDALLDAVMAAHSEIARRRFGRQADDATDPTELMDAAGYQPKSDEVASVVLNEAGVPGHAFRDGASRGATDLPAYNLVIYADDVARIVDRYARQTGEIGRATDDPAGLTESLRLSFGRSTEALLEAGSVRIVATPADIPGGPHPADVKGATAPDGTVYIVSQNVAEAEARGMLLHEVGVHVGMERMLGTEVFSSVLAELDDAIMRGESWAQAARDRVPKDTAAGLVREEQLAYLVQHAPELPIVQRIIAAVRAWAYRTFEFARDRMSLTEADFRAMAVSALHHAARAQEVPAGLVPAYSRGETPDPSSSADELKPFDEAVKRAKSYAAVLRAAADKLDNDAQATAAMRAAMPDISPVEITDLLDQLRQQVKGLRGVARKARSAMASEDVAAGLQFEAMQAADELANNLELAAVIEKRNAALNMNVRLKATAYVNQFRDAGLDFEGFRGLLVGTERKRAGGRISVEAEQKNFRGEWMGGLIADLEKADLMRAFTSGDFDRQISMALWNLGKGADMKGIPAEAVQIAEVINKYQTDARNTRNRFGAWIRDLQGYITKQSHDMFKIRDAGERAWIDYVLPRLDIAKMQRLGLITNGDVEASLRGLYDDFAAGSHMKTQAGEADMAAYGVGSSLAKRESVSRSLYFKDGNASFEYNEKFGQGRLAEAVLQGLDQAGKSAGLLKLLGTNPEATLTRVFDEYAESLRGDPARRAAFLSKRKELQNLLATVDGSANVPGNVTAAQISSFLRAWQSMAKLGGALISSVTDLANYAAELRFGQDKTLLGGVLDGMGSLTQGRASGEKKQILAALGVFHESTLGSVYARFDSPDLLGGKTAAAMQMFFKLTGLNWWTESLRDGYALTHSNYLANNAGQAFDKLPASLRDMLGLYNIDAGKWDILRIATMQEADGRKYMTPEGLKTVPVAALENYITSIGRTVSDASILNLQDDLASALRTMTIDRMHHAVIEPGARSRAFMLRGTQPGTVPGEILRFITQFKSFPVALIQMTLGREVYGRGYDTIGQYIRQGRGDMVGLASFIALSTAMGYAAMSAKDLLRGKNPRPVDDPRTWAAAMVQGGGLGIYGDFLFQKYNRMGGTLTGSMAGPVANTVDTLADLWTRIRTGDDVAAAAFNAAVQNTPFMSLFYARTAFDYLILYRIQETLNPGFLRRMEQRAKNDNGQTYYLPPTSVAR